MARPPPDPIYLLRGSDYPITALKFLQSANEEAVLASGNLDGCVQIWDMKTYRCKKMFVHDAGKSVLWLDVIPGSAEFVSQSRGGTVHVWVENGGEFIQTGSLNSALLGFCAGSFLQSPSNSPVLVVPSPSHQSEVELIDIRNKLSIAKIKPNTPADKLGMCMAIKSVSRASDISQLLIGYENGSVILWDFVSQKVQDVYKAHQESLMCFDYSRNSNVGISGSTDARLSIWKIFSNEKIEPCREIEITNRGVNSVLIRHDDKIFVTAGWDNRVRVFGLKKLVPLAVLSCHTDSVQCLDFSPNNILACGSKDKRISLWNIYQ